MRRRLRQTFESYTSQQRRTEASRKRFLSAVQAAREGGMTLEEIGTEIGRTRQRVWQILQEQ